MEVRVGYIPFHVELSMSTVDDSENLKSNLTFLETKLSRFWRRMSPTSSMTLANGLIRLWDGDRAPVCRNRSKIGLCGLKRRNDKCESLSGCLHLNSHHQHHQRSEDSSVDLEKIHVTVRLTIPSSITHHWILPAIITISSEMYICMY